MSSVLMGGAECCRNSLPTATRQSAKKSSFEVYMSCCLQLQFDTRISQLVKRKVLRGATFIPADCPTTLHAQISRACDVIYRQSSGSDMMSGYIDVCGGRASEDTKAAIKYLTAGPITDNRSLPSAGSWFSHLKCPTTSRPQNLELMSVLTPLMHQWSMAAMAAAATAAARQEVTSESSAAASPAMPTMNPSPQAALNQGLIAAPLTSSQSRASALSLPHKRIAAEACRPPTIKKYRCDECGKSFSRSNTLVTHKRIHSGEKPFECDSCGRAFRQPGNLTRHKLTHTTVKPYVCSTCGKAFNRASNLHTHKRTHTVIPATFTSQPSSYACHLCTKVFHHKVELTMHRYAHYQSSSSSVYNPAIGAPQQQL